MERERVQKERVARRARLFRASDLWRTHNVEFCPEHQKKREKMGRENQEANYKTKVVGYSTKKKRTSDNTTSIPRTVSPDMQANNADDSSCWTTHHTIHSLELSRVECHYEPANPPHPQTEVPSFFLGEHPQILSCPDSFPSFRGVHGLAPQFQRGSH